MDSHIYTRELLDKHLLPGLKEIAQALGIVPDGNKTRRKTWVEALTGQPFPVFQSLNVQAQEPIELAAENSPGVTEDAIELGGENSPSVDRVQEPIEFSDLASALAEIARLRVQNAELLEVVRRAKDVSPVEKPSLKRVLHLAKAACLDVFKSAEGNWTLSMGHLKRNFKKLRDIWDLLIADDWYLMDLFSPPPLPVTPKPLFPPTHSRYSAVPFCDDGLIDTWSLGVNAVSSGRAPPAGGDAM